MTCAVSSLLPRPPSLTSGVSMTAFVPRTVITSGHRMHGEIRGGGMSLGDGGVHEGVVGGVESGESVQPGAGAYFFPAGIDESFCGCIADVGTTVPDWSSAAHGRSFVGAQLRLKEGM